MHRIAAIAWLVVAAAGLLAGGCRGGGCGGEVPWSGANPVEKGDEAASEDTGVDGAAEQASGPPKLQVPEAAFSWGEALSWDPSTAAEKLGEPKEECPTDIELPSDPGRRRQAMLGGAPFCEYPEPRGPEGAPYVVRGILFSGSRPTVIQLVPDGEVAMDEGLEEALQIPEFPERRTTVSTTMANKKQRRVAFRVERVPEGDAGEPRLLGVDVFSKPGDLDRVGHAVVYALTEWEGLVDIVRLEGPKAVGEDYVLPESRAREAFDEETYVRFGRETVWFGPAPTFPRDTGSDDGEVSTLEFPVEQLGSEEPPDVSPIEAMATEQKNTMRFMNNEIATDMFVGIDWTVPTGRLLEFRELLRGTEGLKLKLLGRRVEDWNQRAADAETTAFETGIEVAGWGRGRELPGGFLSVEITSVGFEVHVGKGEAEAAVDGCPDGGPTVCLRDDAVEVGEAFLEARRLRGEERFEEADQKMREGLGAYDWGRLAGKLAEEQAAGEREDVLLVHTAPELPAALPVRVAAMMRTRRCTASVRERLEETQPEGVGDWGNPCREGPRVPRFFDDRILVPFDAFWKERQR